jgi:hypothetical protein
MSKNEPIHPTYGTLDDLLVEIARDIREGYMLRIGLLGALGWFADAYGRVGTDLPEGRREAE